MSQNAIEVNDVSMKFNLSREKAVGRIHQKGPTWKGQTVRHFFNRQLDIDVRR